ncbi:hypothetical protein COO60DRAFT_1034550 [Scenedesmus sp. NREL 46B-D3]|nr:hypothetical protein COO60DRAFT_1034550 [Scenedesmus sp. NREL 46B-D3]
MARRRIPQPSASPCPASGRCALGHTLSAAAAAAAPAVNNALLRDLLREPATSSSAVPLAMLDRKVAASSLLHCRRVFAAPLLCSAGALLHSCARPRACCCTQPNNLQHLRGVTLRTTMCASPQTVLVHLAAKPKSHRTWFPAHKPKRTAELSWEPLQPTKRVALQTAAEAVKPVPAAADKAAQQQQGDVQQQPARGVAVPYHYKEQQEQQQQQQQQQPVKVRGLASGWVWLGGAELKWLRTGLRSLRHSLGRMHKTHACQPPAKDHACMHGNAHWPQSLP